VPGEEKDLFMRRLILISITGLLVTHSVFAQRTFPDASNPDVLLQKNNNPFQPADQKAPAARDSAWRFPRPAFYTISYAGNNAWNPGIAFDSGFLLKSGHKHRNRGNSILKQSYFLTRYGFYLDPGSHAAFYGQYGFSFRKTGPEGWFRSLEVLPLGSYRSFLPETWAVEEGEPPRRLSLAGRTYFAPGINVQVGKHHSDDQEKGWFAGCGLTFLIPYNTYVMPVFTAELGWRFSVRKEGN
jgi:hypothetical protein